MCMPHDIHGDPFFAELDEFGQDLRAIMDKHFDKPTYIKAKAEATSSKRDDGGAGMRVSGSDSLSPDEQHTVLSVEDQIDAATCMMKTELGVVLPNPATFRQCSILFLDLGMGDPPPAPTTPAQGITDSNSKLDLEVRSDLEVRPDLELRSDLEIRSDLDSALAFPSATDALDRQVPKVQTLAGVSRALGTAWEWESSAYKSKLGQLEVMALAMGARTLATLTTEVTHIVVIKSGRPQDPVTPDDILQALTALARKASDQISGGGRTVGEAIQDAAAAELVSARLLRHVRRNLVCGRLCDSPRGAGGEEDKGGPHPRGMTEKKPIFLVDWRWLQDNALLAKGLIKAIPGHGGEAYYPPPLEGLGLPRQVPESSYRQQAGLLGLLWSKPAQTVGQGQSQLAPQRGGLGGQSHAVPSMGPSQLALGGLSQGLPSVGPSQLALGGMSQRLPSVGPSQLTLGGMNQRQLSVGPSQLTFMPTNPSQLTFSQRPLGGFPGSQFPSGTCPGGPSPLGGFPGSQFPSVTNITPELIKDEPENIPDESDEAEESKQGEKLIKDEPENTPDESDVAEESKQGGKAGGDSKKGPRKRVGQGLQPKKGQRSKPAARADIKNEVDSQGREVRQSSSHRQGKGGRQSSSRLQRGGLQAPRKRRRREVQEVHDEEEVEEDEEKVEEEEEEVVTLRSGYRKRERRGKLMADLADVADVADVTDEAASSPDALHAFGTVGTVLSVSGLPADDDAAAEGGEAAPSSALLALLADHHPAPSSLTHPTPPSALLALLAEDDDDLAHGSRPALKDHSPTNLHTYPPPSLPSQPPPPKGKSLRERMEALSKR
eukprot:gene1319-32672_t